MTESTSPTTTQMEPLGVWERRVLGVLIEKQKTSKSPDAYPMTVNAITTGCNQKSNRDPLLNLDEDDVEETLLSLNKRILVNKVQGGRVEKWRHLVYDFWKATQVEMAVVAELLLRGSQTEGDLRGRASRMNDIPDLDTLRELLQSLVQKGLVQYLTSAGRGAVVTHCFYTTEELAEERTRHAGAASIDVREVVTKPSGNLEAKLVKALQDIEELKRRVAALEQVS